MSTVEVETRPEPDRRPGGEPLLRLVGVKKYFPITRGILFQHRVGNVHAVDGIDLEVRTGETLGVVGETGCGKSTAGRVITKLLDPTDGQVWYAGKDISGHSRRQMRFLRGEISMIFQDPYASLNPRKTVGSIIGEPMLIHGIAGEGRVKLPLAPVIRSAPWLSFLGAFVVWLAGLVSDAEIPGMVPLGLLALAIVLAIGGPAAHGARGSEPRALQPLPSRVLGWPAAAHRGGTGPGAAT
jgi:hypothetical protein